MQLAFDGDWEQAQPIYPRDAKRDQIRAAISDAQEFAVEAFFPHASDRPLHGPFIGVRIPPDSRLQRSALLHALVAAAAGPPGTTPARYAAWLSRRLRRRLFEGPAAHRELGVVNEWRSAGAIRVPRGATAPWIEQLERRAPHLFAFRSRPVALEIAFEEPIPHWRGVPVSVPDGAGYRLDRQLLRAAIVGPARFDVASSLPRG